MLCVRLHIGRLLTLSGLHYMHVSPAFFICTRRTSRKLVISVPGQFIQGGAQKRVFTLCVRHHVGRLLTLLGLHYMRANLALVGPNPNPDFPMCTRRTSRKLMVSVPGTTFLTCACHAPQVMVRGPVPKVRSIALLRYWSGAQCPKCSQLLFYGIGQRPSAQSTVSCSFTVSLVQGRSLVCACRTQHCQKCHTPSCCASCMLVSNCKLVARIYCSPQTRSVCFLSSTSQTR